METTTYKDICDAFSGTGSFKVTTQIDITRERIGDLLSCAFEGGSNYWAVVKEKQKPEAMPFRWMANVLSDPTYYADYPLNRGGFLMVGDIEGDMPDGLLDLGTIRHGLQVMADKYPRHFSTFLNENEDADTGDVFLQCCLWGEVIFG